MSLVFGIGPVHRDADGADLRRSMAQHLATQLQSTIEIRSAGTYAEIEQWLCEGRVHFAWVSPAVFVRASVASEVELLAATDRAGGRGYRGVLFVPSSSAIHNPSDLAGKRVAWVDKDSCAGHLFVRLALKNIGMTAQDTFSEQKYWGSHFAAVRAVSQRLAECGATHAQLSEDGRTIELAGWQPLLSAASMRALVVSDPIPADVVCASSGLSSKLRLAVRKVLLELHEGAGGVLVDQFFNGPRLIQAVPSSYDAVRHAMVT